MQITHRCDGDNLPDYPTEVKLSDVNVWMHGSGMLAKHDYPCSVCRNNPAVLSLDSGIMSPCWECQRDGWMTIKTEDKRGSIMGLLKSILLSILIVWAISYSLSCLIAYELLNPTKIITDWTEWVPAWFVYLAVYYWPSKK